MNWYNLLKFAAIKLLHGTSSNFTEFDLSFAGRRDWGDFGLGVYLTRSDGLAKMYAQDSVKDYGGDPIVYLVEANVSNLADMDDPNLLSKVSNETSALFPKENKPGEPQSRPEQESRDITELLTRLGYDGVTLNDARECVVFDPAKIKILESYNLRENRTVPFWLSGI